MRVFGIRSVNAWNSSFFFDLEAGMAVTVCLQDAREQLDIYITATCKFLEKLHKIFPAKIKFQKVIFIHHFDISFAL